MQDVIYLKMTQFEKKLGTFIDRMAAEQAGGDEVWWYVTRFPHHPEITLSIDDQEIELKTDEKNVEFYRENMMEGISRRPAV